MEKTHRTDKRITGERGILVGCGLSDYGEGTSLEVLDELAELAKTAEVVEVARFYQRRPRPDTSCCVGKGKVQEVASAVREHEANVVLFDNDLTPRQVRNLEERLSCKVLDRSEIILDIFASHAKTLEAKLQVELAQLNYTRPRLKRMWTHLSRIAGQGGIGSRGPGEKQIETDRRLIDRRIHALEQEIVEINSRKERIVSTRRDEFTVSLVGYTNAGKSTLMNQLTGAGVYEADKLFATLDTKTSDFNLPNGTRVLLSDTVGFIENLPHHLVASFHATLEEVRRARLLLHVVDGSSAAVERQIETVHRVLEKELGLKDQEEIIVFNKSDAVEDPVAFNVLKDRHRDHITLSALTGEGVKDLIAVIEAFDERSRRTLDLLLPASDGKTMAELNRLGQVHSTGLHRERRGSQGELAGRLLQSFRALHSTGGSVIQAGIKDPLLLRPPAARWPRLFPTSATTP